MILSALSALASLFSMTDEQAMWRVAMQDDGQAFAQLVARWGDPIRRLGERMTGDAHRAEDIAQEAFARVFAHRREYQPAAKFSTWLWRIALNLCHDDLRRRGRRGEVSLDDEMSGPAPSRQEWVAEIPAPDDALARDERHALVRGALQELDEPIRAVVVLKHYEQLKFREIAEILDIPEGTAKSRMTEGLTRLARRLTPVLADKPAHPHRPAPRSSTSEILVL